MKLEQYVNYYKHERIRKKPKDTSSVQYRARALQDA
ncbi:IS3 family transposase [Paenibacillus chitinolyticus]